jgi:hypothetical protein
MVIIKHLFASICARVSVDHQIWISDRILLQLRDRRTYYAWRNNTQEAARGCFAEAGYGQPDAILHNAKHRDLQRELVMI